MFQSLGSGERGALRLFLKEKAHFIVTDDRAFLNVLVRNRTPFLTPAELLVRLLPYALRLLSRGELSLSRSAELLGLSPGEVLDLAAQRGIEIGGTLAQHRAGGEGRT